MPNGRLPADFDYARTHNTYSLARFVRAALDLAGPAFVVSTACAATAKVFASAARMIAAGVCDAALVGGADTLCETTLYGFRSLGVVADEPCRPFDAERRGISIGEAAGFVLLERPRARGDDDAVLLLGIGESSDAYHMSSPHPEGIGARQAMERALASAGVSAAAIDYINLHGTATPVGDAAEDHAVFDLFGSAYTVQLDQGFHRTHPRRVGGGRGDLRGSRHPARLHARKPAYANGRSRFQELLSLRRRASPRRPCDQQFIRLWRGELQPRLGTRRLMRVYLEGDWLVRAGPR